MSPQEHEERLPRLMRREHAIPLRAEYPYQTRFVAAQWEAFFPDGHWASETAPQVCRGLGSCWPEEHCRVALETERCAGCSLIFRSPLPGLSVQDILRLAWRRAYRHVTATGDELPNDPKAARFVLRINRFPLEVRAVLGMPRPELEAELSLYLLEGLEVPDGL